MPVLTKDNDNKFLYLSAYEHFKQMILDGALSPGQRLPSLRKAAQELDLSRTTLESAYLLLAADGYILARPNSGYYVTDLGRHLPPENGEILAPAPVLYDFSTSGADPDSFRLDLWSRYMKHALRQDERMRTYGDAQGEADLRQALTAYLRRHRNIYCSPEQIVVGASTQSLLQLVCPLLKPRQTVSFPTEGFSQGRAVFSDFGFSLSTRDKNCDIIYVSPAQMTKWGELMPPARRMELVSHARQTGRLVIEDDYGNEFIYLPKPAPSLFGLDQGEHVLYLGSFSRLLLPSIRISFMILPSFIRKCYHKKANLYNQTASKAEQIALAQFITDGQFEAQLRRQRRIYGQKRTSLLEAVQKVFPSCKYTIGPAGTVLALTLSSSMEPKAFVSHAQKNGIRLQAMAGKKNELTVLLSCQSLSSEDFVPGLELLRKIHGEQSA